MPPDTPSSADAPSAKARPLSIATAAQYTCTAVAACILVALGGCAAWVLLPMWRDARSNDRHLDAIADQMIEIEHPPGTSRVRVKKKVGLLIGNGNHCDYFVGELRTFSGADDAVIAFYSGKTIHNPVGDFDQKVQVAFPEPDGRFGDWLPDCSDSLDAWGLTPDERALSLYLVYVFSSFRPNRDMRCH